MTVFDVGENASFGATAGTCEASIERSDWFLTQAKKQPLGIYVSDL